MPAEIMYGKPVAEQIEKRVEAEVHTFRKAHNVVPRLDIVMVGKSLASQRYVKKKQEACERLGMCANLHLFDEDVTAAELRDHLVQLSDDPAVHGLLVQLPLPPRIEEPDESNGHVLNKFDLFDAIRGEKDVDGVSRYTIPELYRARQDDLLFLPGTALAVRRMIAYYKIKTLGKNAVVAGRNDITAKPILHMFGGRMCNSTAIWVHRHTPKADHDRYMRDADIIVTSVGSERYCLTADVVKPGAAVFDVGTRVTADGKLHGDVDYESVREVASHITPVPGGVGPVTVAALTENVLKAAQYALGVGKRGYTF